MRRAYQRVADELDVSARTVQRTWKTRSDLLGNAKEETTV